jgi:hypothetical protein
MKLTEHRVDFLIDRVLPWTIAAVVAIVGLYLIGMAEFAYLEMFKAAR